MGYMPVIAFNKRNIKNKINKFITFEKHIYKKRIIVENYSGSWFIFWTDIAHSEYKYKYNNEVGWLKIYQKMFIYTIRVCMKMQMDR